MHSNYLQLHSNSPMKLAPYSAFKFQLKSRQQNNYQGGSWKNIICLGSASAIFFAYVIEQISEFAMAVFGSYFGNVVLFN